MEKLISEINAGKTRGYRTTQIISGTEYFVQYAIKKKKGAYIAYYFMIDSNKMANIEDYGIEEKKIFTSIENAFSFINEKGGDLKLFKFFLGISPL